ncbi:hypothetical protein L7F22_030606 [Adiantum nelumboides]|nr:hypothetical protein [Adiantum nelumboides]
MCGSPCTVAPQTYIDTAPVRSGTNARCSLVAESRSLRLTSPGYGRPSGAHPPPGQFRFVQDRLPIGAPRWDDDRDTAALPPSRRRRRRRRDRVLRPGVRRRARRALHRLRGARRARPAARGPGGLGRQGRRRPRPGTGSRWGVGDPGAPRRRRRRRRRGGRGRRRDGDLRGERPRVRRAGWAPVRPVRPRLDARHPHRGPHPGRDPGPHHRHLPLTRARLSLLSDDFRARPGRARKSLLRQRFPRTGGEQEGVATAARPSPRPVRPRPSVVVPETATGPPAASVRGPFCLGAPRADLRVVADDLHRGVADRPARFLEQAADLGQQRGPARPGPLRAAGAEHRAQVAEAGRGEQRVAERVRGDVAVGVPGAAVHTRATAARPRGSRGRARPGARRCRCRPSSSFLRRDRGRGPASNRPAMRRSQAVVTLNATGSPATGGAVDGRGDDAVGVDPLHGVDHGQDRDHRGQPGTHGRHHPADDVGWVSGRAASCTSTTSTSDPTARRPAATDAVRSAPPGTTVTGRPGTATPPPSPRERGRRRPRVRPHRTRATRRQYAPPSAGHRGRRTPSAPPHPAAGRSLRRARSPRHPTGPPPSSRRGRSGVRGGEHLVEQDLGPLLVGALGQRELTDQYLPGLGQHPLLARGQPPVLLTAPQVADDLGHLVHVTRGELLPVRLISAGPVRGLLGVRRAQHLEDPIQAFLTDHVADADDLDVVRGNAYRQITLSDLQDEVLNILTLDRSSLDRLDECGTVVRVDDGLSDLENHVSSGPFRCTQVNTSRRHAGDRTAPSSQVRGLTTSNKRAFAGPPSPAAHVTPPSAAPAGGCATRLAADRAGTSVWRHRPGGPAPRARRSVRPCRDVPPGSVKERTRRP